jgi:3-phosphoshikimate 1-carboxyvinyltransferase
MNKIISPTHKLMGHLRVPSDRSITVRAVLLASIAEGTSQVRVPLHCDDTDACIDCMRQLGVQMTLDATTANGVDNLTIHGRGLHGLIAPRAPLFCGSSGTTMRLLAGLMGGQAFDSTLDGTAQLRKRPMRRISEPLRLMGARIDDNNGCAPLKIGGQTTALKGMIYPTPVASAQVKSAILLAGLYANGETVVGEMAKTRDHTERMLAAMGVPIDEWKASMGLSNPQARTSYAFDERYWVKMSYTPHLQPFAFTVPADFSSAAFFMVAASIVPHAELVLRDVGINDTRIGLLDALQQMGASITLNNKHNEGAEPVADIMITAPKGLSAIDIGGELTARSIDELPIFAVAATQAHGTTLVRNAEELRVKESNRLEGFVAELSKLGAKIEPTHDGFLVEGPTPLRGAVVDGLGDHRVAMSLAVAGLIAQGETTIVGADCVSKTYPTFFDDLAMIVK